MGFMFQLFIFCSRVLSHDYTATQPEPDNLVQHYTVCLILFYQTRKKIDKIRLNPCHCFQEACFLQRHFKDIVL